jgi:ubiquinone/menaquinone biosynthesis C-methylase UbiE
MHCGIFRALRDGIDSETQMSAHDSVASSATIAELARSLLVCPRSHAPLSIQGDRLVCAVSGFSGQIREGVAVTMESQTGSFFDDKFHVMSKGHDSEGEWNLCYAQQCDYLIPHLAAGQTVLDVGCGPGLPYQVPAGVTVVGLEPSFHSIHANKDVALRVNGTATEIPMANGSVDAVVCFYSIHHMVGSDLAKTRETVEKAFNEFGRVLKPGGLLFVFEMAPVAVFSMLQRHFWNPARRLMTKALDMHFWPAKEMVAIGASSLPAGSGLEELGFRSSALSLIRPVFSMPWLKVPRFGHPLSPKLYLWRMPVG